VNDERTSRIRESALSLYGLVVYDCIDCSVALTHIRFIAYCVRNKHYKQKNIHFFATCAKHSVEYHADYRQKTNSFTWGINAPMLKGNDDR